MRVVVGMVAAVESSPNRSIGWAQAGSGADFVGFAGVVACIAWLASAGVAGGSEGRPGRRGVRREASGQSAAENLRVRDTMNVWGEKNAENWARARGRAQK